MTGSLRSGAEDDGTLPALGVRRSASVRLGRDLGDRHAAGDAHRLADLLLDLLGDGGVVAQELARVVLPLADLLALVGVPGAGLLDDAVVHPELDDLALAGDALVVEDVEIRCLE